MKTPDINALRRKQNNNSTSSSANTNTSTNVDTTTNASDDDGYIWFVLAYLYLVPSMIWTSFDHGFDYRFIDFFRTVFVPFKYIKLGAYWTAAGIVVGNIATSIILLIVLGMLSETIDNGVWDTEMEFDGKVMLFYILIFVGFFIIPLTRPW